MQALLARTHVKRSRLALAGAVCGACCVAGTAAGAVRQSADYAIASESSGESGAASASSANYAVLATAEAWCGVSAVASPDERLRHGFAGQEYEVSAVAVSAAPASVNEEATRQAQAVALLDDLTALSLAGGAASWRVDGWPLAGVTAAGLVTGAAVYANTSGVVRARYDVREGALSLLVLNQASDNFGSYAGDLLEDAWQVGWFGLDNPDAAPAADADEDLQDNRYEWTTGTSPIDGDSFLRFWIEGVAGQPSQRNLCLTPVHAGRTYTLWSRPSLVSGDWAVQPATPQDDGEKRTLTDTTATEPAKFYQLRITRP